MPPSPTIREACFEDYSGIRALESRYGLISKNYEEWKNLWLRNPAYAQSPSCPIGWVVENEHKAIVGHIASIPLSYEFEGRPVVATTGNALVLDSDYRAYSVSLLRCFFNQKNVDLILDTTVNSKASKVLEMFRARRVPTGTWDESSFWITDYQGFIKSALITKGLRAAGAFAYPVSVGLKLKQTLSRWASGKQNAVEISTCHTFDDRFDKFWDQLRHNRRHILLASRSREVLEWHFQSAVAQNRAWVVTVDDRSGMAAYAIFYRDDKIEIQLKRLRLADFQTLDGNNELLAPILSWALEQCRNQGIHMLETVGLRPDKQRIVDELKPHKRKLGSWRYFYRTNDRVLAEKLQNAQVWDPCDFDGDSSL